MKNSRKIFVLLLVFLLIGVGAYYYFNRFDPEVYQTLEELRKTPPRQHTEIYRKISRKPKLKNNPAIQTELLKITKDHWLKKILFYRPEHAFKKGREPNHKKHFLGKFKEQLETLRVLNNSVGEFPINTTTLKIWLILAPTSRTPSDKLWELMLRDKIKPLRLYLDMINNSKFLLYSDSPQLSAVLFRIYKQNKPLKPTLKNKLKKKMWEIVSLNEIIGNLKTLAVAILLDQNTKLKKIEKKLTHPPKVFPGDEIHSEPTVIPSERLKRIIIKDGKKWEKQGMNLDWI